MGVGVIGLGRKGGMKEVQQEKERVVGKETGLQEL